MKLQHVFAGLCLTFIAISCTKSNSQFDDSLYSIGIDQCQTVRHGSDRMTICTDELSDTRCPEDVVCVWGGLAYAKFTVTVSNVAHTLVMSPKAFPSYNHVTDTTIGGFKIEFLDILPHRRVHAPPVTQHARLRITHP